MSFWVVISHLSHPETNPPLYLECFQWAYKGKSPFMQWTEDINKAMRFCREQDAKAAMVDHHEYVRFRDAKDAKNGSPWFSYLERDMKVSEAAV